jgi:hypothetical protein
MTNILFQMQKEIYKLKRRAHHVEQTLANQTQSGHPIIRIPRLTRGKNRTNIRAKEPRLVFLSALLDEITTICVNDKQTQQHLPPPVPDENNTISPIIINNTESLSK